MDLIQLDDYALRDQRELPRDYLVLRRNRPTISSNEPDFQRRLIFRYNDQRVRKIIKL